MRAEPPHDTLLTHASARALLHRLASLGRPGMYPAFVFPAPPVLKGCTASTAPLPTKHYYPTLSGLQTRAVIPRRKALLSAGTTSADPSRRGVLLVVVTFRLAMPHGKEHCDADTPLLDQCRPTLRRSMPRRCVVPRLSG